MRRAAAVAAVAVAAAAVSAPTTTARNSVLSRLSVAVAVLMMMVVLMVASPATAVDGSDDGVAADEDNAGTPEPKLVLELLALSVRIVEKAGQIVRNILETKDLDTVIKGPNDYQTRADRNAQQCIVASFDNLYPNVKVIAEESNLVIRDSNFQNDWIVTDYDQDLLKMECPSRYSNAKEKDIVIWVDPLDATSSFTHGEPKNVTILIGICLKGYPVAGVIYQPFWEKGQVKGRTLWGLVGGSYGGFELKLMPKKPEDPYVFVTCRGSPPAEHIEKFLNGLQSNKLHRVAGSGNKMLYLLEGKAHAYVYPNNGCRRWDTAGPEAVLRAVGGELTDVYGDKYLYTKNYEREPKDEFGIFATAPEVDHDDFMVCIKGNAENTKDVPFWDQGDE